MCTCPPRVEFSHKRRVACSMRVSTRYEEGDCERESVRTSRYELRAGRLALWCTRGVKYLFAGREVTNIFISFGGQPHFITLILARPGSRQIACQER